MKRTTSNLPGFTLVEVLITIVVLVIGCLGVLSLQMTAMEGSSAAEGQTVAVFLAESEIERIKSLDVKVLASEAEAYKDTPVVETLDRFGHPYVSGSPGTPYTRTVTYYPKLPTSLSSQIEVVGAWKRAFGERSVFYTAAVTGFSF